MKPNSRNPWPIAIVAWFVFFTVATVALVILATHQREDLVREDYYDEEVRFQQQIDRMNRTARVASGVAVRYDIAAQNLVVTLPADQARRSPSGQITLYRPSDSRLDQELPLALEADGIQRIDVSHLQTGLWKVRLRWDVSGDEFYSDQEVVIGAKNTQEP